MATDILLIAVLNLIVGVLIIVIPGLLRWIIGGYFLLSGLIWLIFSLM